MGESHSLKTMNSHNLEEHYISFSFWSEQQRYMDDLQLYIRNYAFSNSSLYEFSPNPISWRLGLDVSGSSKSRSMEGVGGSNSLLKVGTNETLVLAHHYHMPNTKSKCCHQTEIKVALVKWC